MNLEIEVIHGHVSTHILEDNGVFPNNPKYPVIVYKGAFHLHPTAGADSILEIFEKNNWSNGWKDTVYDYDHYHSNTHEVLAVYCGTGDLHLGGPEGVSIELTRGDVLIIPAGVAHKNIGCTLDFACVGAYPDGRSYDMNYGKEEERATAIENIRQVPVPLTDPVYGTQGGLLELWNQK